MWSKSIRMMNKFFEMLTAILLAIMVILVFMQIISREIINSSFPWTEEIARYMMIWITFIGGSIAFGYGAHIGIDYFKEKSSKYLQKTFEIVTFFACTLFFFLLVKYGVEIVGKSFTQTSPALRIPMGYVYAVIPVSGILMFINLVDLMFVKKRSRAR